MIIVDDDEELDDDILAEEGYGALWLASTTSNTIFTACMLPQCIVLSSIYLTSILQVT